MTPTSNDFTALTRRSVLRGVAATGAVVLLGFNVTKQAQAQNAATVFDAWISIEPDNSVTIQVSQAEMGQGIHTTFPAIIADEMDANWDTTALEMAPLSPAYHNPKFPQMFTGNAESTRTFWPVIRQAGANARAMLLQAAAQRWNVPVLKLIARKSVVADPVSGQSATYAELAADAANVTLPSDAKLKAPEEWTLLRRSLPRRDLTAKVTGAPVFGLDTHVDNMVYAAIRHADTPGGTLTSINKDSLSGLTGILGVVEMDGAVAVVATSTWRAIKGSRLLDVTFAPGPKDNFSTESLDALYVEKMDGAEWTNVEAHGDAPAVLEASDAGRVIEAEYHSAWQAHAPMEPMNCVADVRGDRAYILGPTQGQTVVAARVSAALSIPFENVEVERTFLGGGFGRRLVGDYAVQAALVSRAMGKPAQIIWTREEDIRHDFFRPHVRNRLKAVLAEDGLPEALDQKVVSPTILSPVVAQPLRFVYPQPDPSVFEGMTSEALLYGIENHRAQGHVLDVPLPTMVWRTTGYGPNVFAIESFVDELAGKAGVDPIEYRITLLERTAQSSSEEEERRTGAERGIAVLQLLKEKSNFGTPQGMAQGVAYSHCFQTHIAQVADVSVDSEGALDIHKITTVLDGGYVLDPDITKANIEGGICWGLTQALTSQITFANGRAQQANFDTFEILALPEAPPTEFHYIDSRHNPGGLGEVGPVATAPALTNAIAAATGQRLRTLPLSAHGIHTRYRKQYLTPAQNPAAPKA